MLSVEILSGVCSTRQGGETSTVSKQCVVRLRSKTSKCSIGCDASNDCFRCNACQSSTRCLIDCYSDNTSRDCANIKTSIEIDCTCCTNCRTRVLNNYTRTSSNNISQLRTITDESCGSDVTGGINFCSCCKTVSSLSNGCTISSLSCSSSGSSNSSLSSRSSISGGCRSNDNTRSKTVSSFSNTNCVCSSNCYDTSRDSRYRNVLTEVDCCSNTNRRVVVLNLNTATNSSDTSKTSTITEECIGGDVTAGVDINICADTRWTRILGYRVSNESQVGFRTTNDQTLTFSKSEVVNLNILQRRKSETEDQIVRLLELSNTTRGQTN